MNDSRLYKNRTEEDALIYLEQVFGVGSIKELDEHREVFNTIFENAVDGYVLDILVVNAVRKLDKARFKRRIKREMKELRKKLNYK